MLTIQFSTRNDLQNQSLKYYKLEFFSNNDTNNNRSLTNKIVNFSNENDSIQVETDFNFNIDENYYRLGSKIALEFIKKRYANILIEFSEIQKFSQENLLKILEGVALRYWKFSSYKFDHQELHNCNIICECDEHNVNDMQIKANEIMKIVNNVHYVRNLVTQPANILGVEEMVSQAMHLQNLDVKVSILRENELKEMGALLAVGKASTQPPALIICELNKKSDQQKTLGLVGKGVMFDSGGLSIKTARGMETMKCDMGGAATVMGLMRLMAMTKSKTHVVAAIPCVENMISGNATRPGDVIRSLSGKTVEILNTDAEGRLILADSLEYIQKNYKIDTLIDFATLTGAVGVALGNFYAGLFSNDDNLAQQLYKVGNEIDDKVWRLPLHQDYDDGINSTIADMKNVSPASFGAGSITAAKFLQRFIHDGVKWAHLDIASTAYKICEFTSKDEAGTGASVRLIYRWIQQYFLT